MKALLQHTSFLRDPLFYAFGVVGVASWFVPLPGAELAWDAIVFKALAEEVFFRFFLQETFNGLFKGKTLARHVGWGNICASACFAAAHLLHHPPHWAAATFFPSLLYGILWDRHHSVIPCWLVHVLHNLCYFGLPERLLERA